MFNTMDAQTAKKVRFWATVAMWAQGAAFVTLLAPFVLGVAVFVGGVIWLAF
jgi:negative regulator of sigma E activity